MRLRREKPKRLLTSWALQPLPATAPQRCHKRFRACAAFAVESDPSALRKWGCSRILLRGFHRTLFIERCSLNQVQKHQAYKQDHKWHPKVYVHQHGRPPSRMPSGRSASLISHFIYGTAKQAFVLATRRVPPIKTRIAVMSAYQSSIVSLDQIRCSMLPLLMRDCYAARVRGGICGARASPEA